MALPHRWFKEKYPYQLHTSFLLTHCHKMTNLLTYSYFQVGIFPHKYHINGRKCPSYWTEVLPENSRQRLDWLKMKKRAGIYAIDFDKQGRYIATGTQSGCITIHDFEVLYTETQRLPLLPENAELSDDEGKHLLHVSVKEQLQAIKWNPINQNQIACGSKEGGRLLIYDANRAQAAPHEYITTAHRRDESNITDAVFASNHPMMIIASDYVGGSVFVWDTRAGTLPRHVIETSDDCLTSVQLDVENQVVFAAGIRGCVYSSDIRRGINLTSMWSASTLRSLQLPKRKGKGKGYNVVSAQINSIRLNPSSSNQMAFNLFGGSSGILDVYNDFQLTHVHEPYANHSEGNRYSAKASWLASCSIFLVPFPRGIRLLDFHPSRNSPWHVDSRGANEFSATRDLPLTRMIRSCTAHPVFDAIVAGTQDTSLVMISQRRESREGDD